MVMRLRISCGVVLLTALVSACGGAHPGALGPNSVGTWVFLSSGSDSTPVYNAPHGNELARWASPTLAMITTVDDSTGWLGIESDVGQRGWTSDSSLLSLAEWAEIVVTGSSPTLTSRSGRGVTKPRVFSCHEVTAGARRIPGDVAMPSNASPRLPEDGKRTIVAFVVDTEGYPRSIQAVREDNDDARQWGVAAIGSCRFHVASFNGESIPMAMIMPIEF